MGCQRTYSVLSPSGNCCILAVLGLVEIVRYPAVLVAAFPWYGLDFLMRNQGHGFLVLGAVFLVVTGAETLYADADSWTHFLL